MKLVIKTVADWAVSLPHLLHLLSESGEDLIAFSQGALKLLKLVHVQGELRDMWETVSDGFMYTGD